MDIKITEALELLVYPFAGATFSPEGPVLVKTAGQMILLCLRYVARAQEQGVVGRLAQLREQVLARHRGLPKLLASEVVGQDGIVDGSCTTGELDEFHTLVLGRNDLLEDLALLPAQHKRREQLLEFSVGCFVRRPFLPLQRDEMLQHARSPVVAFAGLIVLVGCGRFLSK